MELVVVILAAVPPKDPLQEMLQKQDAMILVSVGMVENSRNVAGKIYNLFVLGVFCFIHTNHLSMTFKRK